MFEKLDGLLDGANGISQAEVLARFATTPTDMTMHMQMGMIMYAPTDAFSVWSNIHGSDSLLDPADEPTKDSNRQGGRRPSPSVQLSVHPASGFFKDHQFLVQGEVLVVQSLDDPQLKRRYTLHAAVQWEF